MLETFVLKTPRDIIEVKLAEYCSPNIRCALDADVPVETILKPCMMGSAQSIISTSHNFPHGMIYKEEHALFGIEVTFHSDKASSPTIHILSPRGARWRDALDKFTAVVADRMPEAIICIHTVPANYHSFLSQSKELWARTHLRFA